jgi:hypothetical protein
MFLLQGSHSNEINMLGSHSPRDREGMASYEKRRLDTGSGNRRQRQKSLVEVPDRGRPRVEGDYTESDQGLRLSFLQ